MILDNLIDFCSDVIFPIFCVGCGQEGGWCCEQCLNKIKGDYMPSCPVCNRHNATGETCQSCLASSSLDGVTALFKYSEDEMVGKLLKQFKYNYARGIEAVLQKIITNWGGSLFDKEGKDRAVCLIPVPLHPRRERERGFNQSEILAKILGNRFSFSLDNASLKRIRYTKQQARLSGEQRRENLRAAFLWVNKKSPPDRVLLIDDVFTTGTTMQECARVLKQAGVKQVWGWVLARG